MTTTEATTQPAPPAWPADVVARYLTVGGAHVEILTDGKPAIVYTATCTGCTDEQAFTAGDSRHGTHGDYAVGQVVAEARRWAQGHAETCRAMPSPNA